MIDHEAGIGLLRGRIAKANELLSIPVSKTDYDAWVQTTGDFLPVLILQLEGAIEVLEAEAKLHPQKRRTAALSSSEDSRKVFLVHGHNEAVKYKAARFLERIKLEAIILEEQDSSGLTVIENFELHSEVSFAVVLLTADDIGGVKNSRPENLSLRARQNVIFELGYFVAKLGRKKVRALYEEGVEIPSDYKGVIFVSLDAAGAWRFTLAHEMKGAGLEVDMNNIF